MKSLLLISTLLLAGLTFGQNLIQWGPEIHVADGVSFGNVRPRATVVDGDKPVVIFGKSGTTENLYIARWNGTSFDTPVSILPSGMSSYIANWTGPDIDSKGDTVIAVFKAEPMETGNVYSVRSTDGGLTFSDTIRVDDHPVGVAWMPSMGMTENGDPVITYMAHDAVWNNPRYVMVNSNDAGLNYGSEMEITSAVPGEACDCCPSEMIIDGQNEALLFRNNESNIRNIHAVLSTDGGANFNSYEDVDQMDWSINGCPSTGADAVFMNDKLITAFASAASGKYRIYLSTSGTSGGLTFETRQMLPEPDLANGTQNFPRISSKGDTTVLVWRETVQGNNEIFAAIALPGMDAVASLTGVKEMANMTMLGVQDNPEVVYRNGYVHLFYEDHSSGDLIYRRGVINTSVGIDEFQIDRVNIYPNPSTSGVYQFSSDVNILDVNNLDGRKVEYNFVNNELKLLNNSNGIYIVRYNHNNSMYQQKLTIHK